jgi:hypothetical protein
MAIGSENPMTQNLKLRFQVNHNGKQIKKLDGAFENLQMLQQIVEKPSSPTASLFSLK